MPLSSQDQKECASLMKNSVLLGACTDDQLSELAKSAEKKKHDRGTVLSKEGDPQQRLFLLSSGTVVREKFVDGRVHSIDTHLNGATVGSLHVLNKDQAYATSKCTAASCTTYEVTSEAIKDSFRKNPDFALNVANGLVEEVRRHTRTFRTPLLEQRGERTPFFAVTVASSIESFYRAALNSILNQQLTGVKMGSLFPNMHIQIPTRVVYINGLKGTRQYIDQTVNPDDYSSPNAIRIAKAIAPGLIMTPISSILEASNAGHANPEPMYTRWMRGLVPRAAREVIFGIGLNQLSDYCEERVPASIQHEALRNAAGSLTAGVISGYLSHVVHNLSTLKLMNPNKSYGQHFSDYIKKSEARLPETISPSIRPAVALFSSLFAPVGVHIRTGQIVGSFIILNGTIHALNRLEIKFK